jgi:hypothetical protein
MLLKRASLYVFLAGTLTMAGCGGTRLAVMPGASAPSSVTPISDRASPADRDSGSWMLPEAKNEDLIYVSDYFRHKVFVLALYSGKLVGTFSYVKLPSGLCSDRAGNVYVTRSTDGSKHGVVTEYPHGETTPIAQLKVPWGANSCAVDPATGDLAVSGSRQRLPSIIAIYRPPFQRRPLRRITEWTMGTHLALVFDDKSNLYFDTVSYSYGKRIFKLSKRSNTPVIIQLTPREADFDPVAWHGNYLALGGGDTIEHTRIAGKNGRVIQVTTLGGYHRTFSSQMWIDGSDVVECYWINAMTQYQVGVWSYPSGTNIANFGVPGSIGLDDGITISRAAARR